MGDLMNTYTCMRGVRFQRKKYTIKKQSEFILRCLNGPNNEPPEKSSLNLSRNIVTF